MTNLGVQLTPWQSARDMVAVGRTLADSVDILWVQDQLQARNVYVALAKREVAGVVGIDGFNGPSEVAIVADATAHPQWVAADLLAQAEHGPGGAAIVLTWDPAVADAVDLALAELLTDAPQRAELEDTLHTTGRIVIVDDVDAASAAIDILAPEHLELACADAEKLADEVRNAGAIFVGNYAPAALGDYLACVNHVLPTARTARFASALRVDTFCKHVHVVDVDASAFARVAPAVATLAEVEGLVEHARSVTIREESS